MNAPKIPDPEVCYACRKPGTVNSPLITATLSDEKTEAKFHNDRYPLNCWAQYIVNDSKANVSGYLQWRHGNV